MSKTGVRRRLAAAVDEIDRPVIADIGCDHGHVCIYAALQKKITKAYACDINAGPLGRAAENIRVFGLSDIIETRLGYGLMPVYGTDAESIIIAGLGGWQTIEILANGLGFMPAAKQLVLQPMSEIPAVRAYVLNANFFIKNERLIHESGKYYFILNCAPGGDAAYTEAELLLGRVTLNNKHDILYDFVASEIKKIKRIIGKIDEAGETGQSFKRRDELAERLEIHEKILNNG